MKKLKFVFTTKRRFCKRPKLVVAKSATSYGIKWLRFYVGFFLVEEKELVYTLTLTNKELKKYRQIDLLTGASIMVIVLILAFLLTGCTATKAYKVTFRNGDVEYYELNYKPKANDKYIKTDNGTYLGVQSIEKVK